MSQPFPTSEEYDERAHHLYSEGDLEGALEVLKEGIALYPNSVELYVGLGYARLAREEFAWARRAFERALILDPGHEDGMVGMGEVLLRLGHPEAALQLFREVEARGYHDDLELMISMGRALYREGLFEDARQMFAQAAAARPESPEAVASLGYALAQLGDEVSACRQIRRALRLDPDFHEARLHLAHILYDRGDWEGALREFEGVPPQDHWDTLSVWRTVELKEALGSLEEEDPAVRPWSERLRELERVVDPVDQLLAEVEVSVMGSGFSVFRDPGQLELFEGGGNEGERAIVRLPDGHVLQGTAGEIVGQMRDRAGFGHEPLSHYMRRMAERWREQLGLEIPFSDAESFVKAAVREGLLRIEER